ncbi:cobaltochelatase subunit CobT [Devosia sp. XK-2]|uniref:cobaltochelatase CobT-related protein n=1 Tax=Devosia sp. XK-2 TaxID=3126689 RepID=UPI0030D4016B
MANSDTRSTILKRDEKGQVRHGAEWLALWSDPDSMRSRAELSERRQSERRQMDLVGQLSAAARSLAARDDIDVQVGEADSTGGLRASADELNDQNMPALRGRIDSAALFLRLHDPALDDDATGAGPGETRLLGLLELLRCEAVGARRLRGVSDNLVAAHLARLARADLMGAHLASLVPLEEAVRMVIGDALVERDEPSVPTSGFWMWHRWMHERLQPRIDALVAQVEDQRAYAAAAGQFVAALYQALHGRGEGPVRREISNRTGGPQDGELEHGTAQTDDESFEPGPEAIGGNDDSIPIWPMLELARAPAHPPYRPYTTRHDRVVRAADLVSQQALRDAGRKLDQRRGANKRTMARLVTQLQRRLMARQTRSWTFDLEEGLVDASRLDRVVVNPGFADAYKQEEESEFRDTCVTLLIDNSGSMRGKAIELSCLAADLICAALESCSVATEVLGFSTCGWKGGQSAQDWMRAGRPDNPGRLNDLLHIIYKSADEPYRRTRLNLNAMLSPDLLKENIDGEALTWAARRLMARGEQRRILIVISDGAPVDQATIEANADKEILDRHLREVIGQIERAGQIEMAAIGVRHDVSQYYRSARRIEAIEELGPALIGALDAMLLS